MNARPLPAKSIRSQRLVRLSGFIDLRFSPAGRRPAEFHCEATASKRKGQNLSSNPRAWQAAGDADPAICPPLLDELTGVANHRQIDELRSAVVRRREANHEIAEVDVVHFFQRCDELFTRQIFARSLQTLDHHLADDEPFQAGKIKVRAAGLRQYCLILLHDASAWTPRKWTTCEIATP